MSKDKDESCIMDLGIKALVGIAVHTDQMGHLTAHMCDAIGVMMIRYEGKEFKEALDEVIQTIVDKHTEALRGVEALQAAAEEGIFPKHIKPEGFTDTQLTLARSIIEESKLPDDSKLSSEQERIYKMMYNRIKD